MDEYSKLKFKTLVEVLTLWYSTCVATNRTKGVCRVQFADCGGEMAAPQRRGRPTNNRCSFRRRVAAIDNVLFVMPACHFGSRDNDHRQEHDNNNYLWGRRETPAAAPSPRQPTAASASSSPDCPDDAFFTLPCAAALTIRRRSTQHAVSAMSEDGEHAAGKSKGG